MEEEKRKRDEITFSQLFLDKYSPQAKGNKGAQSFRREQDLFSLWISRVIGNAPLKEIAPFHLERLKKNMAEAGGAPRSIGYALTVVRQVLNFARKNDLHDGESPTSKVKMRQGDNRRLRFFTHGEADLLLESLAKKSPQLYKIAIISLHCGLRAGEIFSFTWGDVDLQGGVMTLRDTKSGRNRTAFMTEAVREILCEKTRGENDDLVFSGRGEGRITSVSQTFDRVVRDLGLNKGVTDPRQKVVFHTLRHSYASWLVESGVDLYTVKELMGHSAIALTEQYSHLGNNTLQNAVKVLEKSMKSGSQGINRAQVDEGSDA